MLGVMGSTAVDVNVRVTVKELVCVPVGPVKVMVLVNVVVGLAVNVGVAVLVGE
jgi:hypothetical protein